MAAVAYPQRPHIRRTSPRLALHYNPSFTVDAHKASHVGVSDSDSDDEPPPAIMFSKVTQDLLEGKREPSSPPRQETVSEIPRFNRSISTGKAALETPSRPQGLKIVRKSSPSAFGENRGNTPPRIVQIGQKNPGSGQRSISSSGPYPHRFPVKRDPTPEIPMKPELITPAPSTRATRRPRTGSNASQDGQAQAPSSLSRSGSRTHTRAVTASGEQRLHGAELDRSTSAGYAPETVSRFGSSTMGRSRNASAEAAPPPGSTRIKRAPIGTGSFLKSGPIRRGFRRRESEDNISPADDAQSGPGSQPSATEYTPLDRSVISAEGARSRSGSVNTRATSVDPVSVHDFANSDNAARDHKAARDHRRADSHMSQSQASYETRPPSRQTQDDGLQSRQPSAERPQRRQVSTQVAEVLIPELESAHELAKQKPALEAKPLQRAPSLGRAQYRYAAPKIHNDASEDQENMPPPTFKRNRDSEFKYFGKPSISILSDDENPKARPTQETPVPVQPQQQERKALGSLSGNTPHRPAPAPPPKMSVLNTATITAGASVTKSKKKRAHIVINGKIFTQMGKIGKGGSSDVFQVMAENYKLFALKKVKLSDCDESAVRGYKGEIELLQKLTEVDRVVRLFDWELNEDKQELLVLMEKGDTDLNRTLTLAINSADAGLNLNFTRMQWQEMLECVQAVHEHDIVHSDLKPANFLLVQGRLKLIDFGIANAIETDHTVNVHRDSHVGTPNYMSPESITDTNASSSGGMTRDAQGRPLKKDMRIGKASDVWSLGCILYQMTYGRPPFAHIQNQISRIMAITNPKHLIEFPDTGIGGVVVPPSLKGTLKKCLNRDPDKRAHISQLLSPDDAFLNPERGEGVFMTPELLGMIITRVVDRCKDPKKGIPTADEVGQYPRSFLERIREMQADG